MEKEISNGAMLGIVLIALAAIIGLGFMVFGIAKNTANEGVVDVQDNLNGVSLSQFEDYNQKIITGTQVMSAYTKYKGKNYAILVATQNYKDTCDADGTPDSSFFPSSDADLQDDTSIPDSNYPIIVTNKGTTNSLDEAIALSFINYNAILNPKELEYKTNTGSVQQINEHTLGYDSGTFIMSGSFKLDTTKNQVKFFAKTSNLSKSGAKEYLPTAARFMCNLVKDNTGTIVGIAFEQMK